MNRQQIVGGFMALKGAGLIGTFTYLDGIRLLDNLSLFGISFSTPLIWFFIILGLIMLLSGLGYAAAADES
ncbi:MAG: hypothetical protein AAF571_02300 [Verrucomicrobiota bacterium]